MALPSWLKAIRKIPLAFFFTVPMLFPVLPVISQITAQWRGPDRSGSYPDAIDPAPWTSGGPPMAWHTEGIGTGYSSAVFDGTHIFVTGMKGSDDVMTCLLPDGKIAWQKVVGPAYDGPYPDTRSTPTVDQERVYAISGLGRITCLNAHTGEVIWSVNGKETFGAVYGDWGVCESPLIIDHKLIYTPAGNNTTMVALDKMTGRTIWTSASLHDTSAYVSPLLFIHGGKQIIATLAERWFFGVDASDGRILWKYDFASLLPEKGLKIWPGAPRTNTNTPLYLDGMIYITGGYDHAGVMFRLSENGEMIHKVWIDTVLDVHHGGVVSIGDYIYGSNWINNSKGNWCCLNRHTGIIAWEHTWFNKGAIIACNDLLLCFDEKWGNIGLVRPSHEKFDLIGSFKVTLGKGPFWAHPTAAHGLLLIRHGDVLMAYKTGGN